MANKLIVVTGATGSGKTAVTNYLRQQYQVTQVITHTTRPPRNNEVTGKDYYFETNASFEDNHYLERVKYASYQYGSSFEGIRRAWQQSPIASIVLDTAGAVTYEQKIPEDIVIVFLQVTDVGGLRQRLIARGDSLESVQQRINSPEFKRDLVLPEALKSVAHVIKSDEWTATKADIDQLMRKLKKEMQVSAK